MLDTLFLTINLWMTGGLLVAAVGCFSWGVVSVLFSPCHMASIPLIIGYVGGQNMILKEREAIPYALVFTSGIFVTIAIVGFVCVMLGRMMGDVGACWTLLLGAFLLGLAYGVLSGSCTFGFIAPILAIITVQKQIATGLFLLTLFALGHCLPIAVAGSSATTVKRILNNSSFHHGGNWFRKGAGVLVGSLGIYFILRPWISV